MHHLAAILFIDIVGYTAMMEESEEKALESVRRLNNTSKPLVEKYKGTWHKDLGDGTLFSFGSAVEAVKCAIEIQQSINVHEDFKTRIGIHVGDVTFEGDDVFGDGVNIASRVQGEAAIGGIAISDAVQNNIKNKNGINTKLLGRRRLKNVSGEIRLFQVKASGIETLRIKRKSYQLFVYFLIGIVVGFLVNQIISQYSVIQNPGEQSPKRYSLTFNEDMAVELIGDAPYGAGQRSFDLSPDGSLLVYVASTDKGPMLALRSSNSFDAKLLEGTEGAYYPFFSPDGEWIAYFTTKQLMRIKVDGLNPEVIMNTTSPKGGFWNRNNQVIISDEDGASIKIVSAFDNTINSNTIPVNNSGFFYWPAPLPSENYILLSTSNRIYICNITTGETELLLSEGSTPKYVDPGYIIYSIDGILKAIKFDLKNKVVVGSPSTVLKNIRTESVRKGSQFSISNSGKLIYATGSAANEGILVFVDRNGTERDTLPLPAENFGSYSLSPDLKHLLYISHKNEGLFLYDIERNINTQVKKGPGFHVWSRDGKSFVYNQWVNGESVILRRSVENSNIDTLHKSETWLGVYSWSFDKRYLAYVYIEENSRNLGYLDLEEENPTPKTLAAQPLHEIFADFAPNGEYYVYSEETTSGDAEVYIRKFPSGESKIKVSDEGGGEAYWTKDGNEIIYISVDYTSMKSVSVNWNNGPKLSSPEFLWKGNYIDIPGRSYSVSPDGNLFLMKKSLESENTRQELQVVENWVLELQDILN